jgi:membrane associated rhomboid family serine protease
MQSIIDQISETIVVFQTNLKFVAGLIASLYLIHCLNWISGFRLNNLGIYPRKLYGLPGILCSPFLHGHFNHLFFNSIPLFVLTSFVLLQGMKTYLMVSAIIVILGGAGTWLIGRRGVHIGASGVIMGYWSYLLIEAYYHPSVMSVVLAVICLYYFGGMILNLFPQEVSASWEAHVSGFLAGLAAAYSAPMLSQLI